ncbi:MAG: primosomal protein N' [Gammaproteobacteria bacterium]
MRKQRIDIVRVAVPSPLRRYFDYLPPSGTALAIIKPGMRVKVPFGRQSLVALVSDITQHTTIARNKLRRITKIIDDTPMIGSHEMKLARWAAEYYQHAPGEVYAAFLPLSLRRGAPAEMPKTLCYALTPSGKSLAPSTLQRAPRQQALLERLAGAKKPLAISELAEVGGSWREALRRLIDKGWVQRLACDSTTEKTLPTESAPKLNDAQQYAVDSMRDRESDFSATLLDGITGSGKTEVYLSCIEHVAAMQRQTLVLLPEIGLTPQAVARYRQRLGQGVHTYHSELSEKDRLATWLAARNGTAKVIIGTRSAVFLPLAQPGLIVIDEEHDTSFKQQDGFRYSARDLAVVRAQQADIPVLLGSATPSFESLENVRQNRYHAMYLPERAGAAVHPTLRILDVRSRPMPGGISDLLADRIRYHLDNGGQVLLFLNRRGYAPVLTCHHCGWIAECQRCDARMTLHRGARLLVCHHCGKLQPEPAQCPSCDKPSLEPMGKGTERIEEQLSKAFPGVELARIDRDSTRRKGELERLLQAVHTGKTRLLVGTQMLAKGHDFPGVSLVGIINADQGLFGLDFRASERLAQLIVQVAGRAGRAEKPGEVLIQTHHPEHPLLRQLVAHGYAEFAKAGLEERRLAGMPPYSALALFRAESTKSAAPSAFLQQVAHRFRSDEELEVLGPATAPMARRAGHVRAQLLLRSTRRAHLNRVLAERVAELEGLPSARGVRWSLDVDPLELF